MNIYRAVKRAVKQDKCISIKGEEEVKIKPTNGRENCISMPSDGSHPSKYGWQPTAQQLLDKRWIVID